MNSKNYRKARSTGEAAIPEDNSPVVEEAQEAEGTVEQEQIPVDQPPTIIISVDQYGDITFGTPTPSLDISLAISMCELVKLKLAGLFFESAADNKKKATETSPRLYLPS